MMRPIYLDHNATSPIDPRVSEAVAACWQWGAGNASSQHRLGRRASQTLEDARDSIARMLGAGPGDRIVFTSGATEANNLALFGLAGEAPGRVLVGATEHPSVLAPAEQLRRAGFEVLRIGVDHQGRLDLEQLRQEINDTTRLVSVMAANHETGVLQPLPEIADICRDRDVPLHTDAVQLVGKLPLDFRSLGVSALSLSAHKLQGPVGIGALLLRADALPVPRMFGGFQQWGIRPGTEPVGLVVGLVKALELWWRQREARAEGITALRDRFEQRLLESGLPIRIQGRAVPRAPHTSNVAFLGTDRQALLMALDLQAIACSTGSACASGSSEASPVLRAMGLGEEVIASSLRFSLGASTTERDVEEAASRILSVFKDLRGRSSRQKSRLTSPQGLEKPV